MEIIESLIKGKYNSDLLCEDAIVQSDDYIAVIDGVTAKGKHIWNGKSSGSMAVMLLKDAILHADPKCSAEEFFSTLTEVLHQAYSREMTEEFIEEKLRASVIVYSRAYHEVWSYGDCQCMISRTHHTEKKNVDRMNEMLRAFYSQYALKSGCKEEQLTQDDPGRKAIAKLLNMQFAFENEESFFGYAILNGDPINPKLIKKYPVKSGSEVVLASDGYPEVFSTLEKSEAYLKQCLEKDPFCICENMQTKGMHTDMVSYDDRSYVRFLA